MDSSPRKPLYPTKPFHELSRAHQEGILQWKKQYSNYNQTLCVHLNRLAVPQLEPYLAWIPPDELKYFKQLAQGGFATVYKAYVVGPSGILWIAAKELKDTMVPEVSHLNVVGIHTVSFLVQGGSNCHLTFNIVGAERRSKLLWRQCAYDANCRFIGTSRDGPIVNDYALRRRRYSRKATM